MIRTARSAISGEYLHADLKRCPAELHINLSAAGRGLALGKALLNACLNQMTALQLSS